MSKLQELINELCPDGVEYKTLNELGLFYGGLTGKSKKDFSNGNSKFITYKNVYSNPSLNLDIDDMVFVGENEKQRPIEYGDIIFTGSSETLDECAFSSVVTKRPKTNMYLNSFCFIFRLNELNLFNLDFLKHLFRSSEIRKELIKTASGVTRFNVSKEKMGKVSIPVPPLPVQEEIVRILDKMTGYVNELEAELEARKMQYEYYRGVLLNDADSQPMTLNQISKSVFSGKNKKRMDDGDFPVYGSTGIISFTDTTVYHKPQILIARVGANAGYVHIADGDYDVSDNTLIVDLKDDINLRYVYYQLDAMNLNQYAKGGGQPLVTAGQMKGICIPIPNLERQNQIVEMLDRFYNICNSLSSGLPAEIEACQKQYEYYRDRLLNFKLIKRSL